MPIITRVATAIVSAAVALGGAPASAGSISTTLDVTATVIDGCQVQTRAVRVGPSQRDLGISAACTDRTLVQTSVLGSGNPASTMLGRSATALVAGGATARGASDEPVLQILF